MLKRIALNDKIVFLGITLYFIICLIVSFTQLGTVDSGDSIMHFLYAKYSFIHPSFFFHHWAKPLFVLLSSPFAQFGIVGMKVFNSIISSLTLLFTFFTAKRFTDKNSFIVVLLLCFAPLNFVITFSGLTEPLFAFFLIFSTYLLISGKEINSSIILSFLPFVRSEGLILIGVFAFYFLIKKKYKILPFLLTGHIIYSVAGYFYYHDFLWVFTKIPYARLSSTYGSGTLFHFVSQLTFVIGIPVYLLLVLGMIFLVISFFYRHYREMTKKYSEKLLLIYFGFIAFIVAHSLFWYLGIFNSMGLKRVLICVIPYIALIGLDGYNFLIEKLIKNKIASGITASIIIAYLIVFPFTRNPAAIKWNREFSSGSDQIEIKEMSAFIKENYPGYICYYYPPYISLELGIDHFDTNKRKELPEIFSEKEIPKNSLIIWDNWYAIVEDGIPLEKLQQDNRFREIKEYNLANSRFVVFAVKN
jgi:hypothetical protein